jgi:hypothetical protein
MSKRAARTSLLDTCELAREAGPLRPIVAATWAQRINAKRFLFDHEASARIGEMKREHTDLIVDNIEFARPPYPTAYFELDALAMWTAWRPDQPPVATADVSLGFLVHNGQVMVLASGQRPDSYQDPYYGNRHLVGGLSFRINRPQSIPLTKLTGQDEETANLIRTAYVFGGQREVDRTPAERDRELLSLSVEEFQRRMNYKRFTLPDIGEQWSHAQIAGHFDVIPAFVNTGQKAYSELCFLSGGDPLTLTTALLLINQPSRYVDLAHVPREVGLWRGKRKVFQAHHVVTLKLSREVKVARLWNLTTRTVPGHEVMGHWKHYNKSEGCDHHHPDRRQAWEPTGPQRTVGGDYKRYWCPLCLQRRTWTEDYSTFGPDATTKQYEVTR